MFRNLAVLNPEHIEPGRFVRLPLRILVFLNEAEDDHISLRYDGDHLAFDFRLDLQGPA